MSTSNPSRAGRDRRPSYLALVLPLLLPLAACSGTEEAVGPSCETDPSLCEPGPTGPDTTAAFLSNLPSWEEFAKPDTVLKNELDAEVDTLPIQEVIVDTVPVFGPDGEEDPMTDVRYVCQERPFTIADAPEKIVMFDPNRSILYAGAFIQGKSKKELGSLLPLAIAERAPINVSIPDLPSGANSREALPTQSAVASARGEMIGDAVAEDLATPTSSTFEMETYHSEQSFALSASLSGRYLGFAGSASGSLDRSLTETTVTAHFVERMYTVVVEPPVGGFFSEEFDNEALAGYVGDGVIGPDNLPVYVSEVVYGRMMMFSVTSTASEQEIRTAMQASYNTFTGSASGGLSTKDKAILEKAKIAITAKGGEGQAVAAMIASGDWSQYFLEKNAPKLSQAVPLSYTFTNVGDGSVAAVTETTDYTINKCTPKPLIPGTFDFNARQDLAVPLTAGYRTLFGDADGDGLSDMIFSHLSGSTNEIAVAFGEPGGTFSTPTAHDATVTPPEGWSLYDQTAVGDFDGDGDDDVLWNRLDDINAFYVALSDGDGTFTWGGRQEHGLKGWSIYDVHVADVNDADGDDLVWNGISGGMNRTYVALAIGGGTFDLTAAGQDKAGTCCWNGTDFMIGDVTGDGLVDLIHSRTNEDDNATWVSAGTGDGTFRMADLPGFTSYGVRGWGDYTALMGDIDADRRLDLFWIAGAREDVPIHRGLGNANGSLTRLRWQHVPNEADGAGPYQVRTGDVDADGDSDIVLVDLDSSNNEGDPVTDGARIWVGLGTVEQVGSSTEPWFDFKPVDQYHPSKEPWAQFAVEVLDVNGDSKADLVLHWNTSPHQIYTALAK